MKMILELNATEAKNAVASGAILGLLETLADYEKETEAPVRELVQQFKQPTLGEVLTQHQIEQMTSEDPEISEVEISEVEIRAKFVALSKKGKKAELKELLTDFGVEKVSDLQPDQYQEAMTKLEAI